MKIKKIPQAILSCANKQQTGVTLKELFDFGEKLSNKKLIQASNFLQHELPIRLAHRVIELDDLPHGLSSMPSVKLVKDWYIKSFEELYHFQKIKTITEEREFTNLLTDIKTRHNATLYTMARGVHELKQELFQSLGNSLGKNIVRKDLGENFLKYADLADLKDIHSFLDKFYMSRIGIRMLMAQHIALHHEEVGWVGCICETSSPAEIALAAIDTARHMCIRQYGDVPEVQMFGHTDLTIPFVPSHLHHMLFEVIKNSMRAVVEFHGVDNKMPPIRIVIADGEENEDVSVKISDEGGGIVRSSMPRIWSYLYTTAENEAFGMIDSPSHSDFGRDSPLAGLGYGLPISRLFARYFGGDLQIISMEGYRTDAYLHLKRVGDACEPLP